MQKQWKIIKGYSNQFYNLLNAGFSVIIEELIKELEKAYEFNPGNFGII